MRLGWRAVGGLVAALVAGCGGSPGHGGADMAPAPGATVTLGGTAIDGSGFVPLAGDQTLVAGAQGGMHVWLKYRVAGMAPGSIRVHRTVHRLRDDASILTTDGTQTIGAPDRDGYWELPTALPSFMCPTPLGISVIDEAVVFDVTMSDASGAVLGHGSAQATVRCPTDAEAALCMRICSG
jgi:hypothetical protein